MYLQVTNMVLKVDLQCSYCYKEVHKILSKFHRQYSPWTIYILCLNSIFIKQPHLCWFLLIVSIELFGTTEITDQNYNKKANTVTITVVSCDPEKIRDKLCSKGSNVIKTIKIKEDPKQPPPEPTEPVLVLSGYPARICYCPGPCYHVYGCQVPRPYCWCGCSGYGQYCHYFNEESPSYCSIV